MNDAQTPLDVGLDVGLTPEVQALLATERTQRDRMPEVSQARVWHRVASTVAPPLPRSRNVAAVKALGTLALGAAIGAGGHALVTRLNAPAPVALVQVRAEPAPAPAFAPLAAPSTALLAPILPPPPPIVTPTPVRPHHPAPPPTTVSAPPEPARPAQPTTVPETSDRALVAERTLIDMARTALTRGESERALEAIDQHTRQFPDGTLVEEREALKVQVFLAQHDSDRAKAAVAAFAQRFPMSLLLPALQASLQRQLDDDATR